MVRVQNNIPPGNSVTAGNAAVAATDLSALMAGLTPLAFKSGKAIQLYDLNADTFLYAIAVSHNGLSVGNLVVPDTAHFIYEDLFRNNVNFATGTTVAKFLFPLTVLNSDSTERAVPAVLNFVTNPARDCSTSTVSANFPNGATSLPATKIGISCSVVFGTSPTSAQKHTNL